MSLSIVVLYADGHYEEKDIASESLFGEILQCKKVITLPPRPEREKFFLNIDENVKCYIGDGALSEGTPSMMSEWTEFVDAIGLMDNEVGCIIGEIIVVGASEELVDMIDYYADLVADRDSQVKWRHLKELTIRYGRLRACQWHNCDRTKEPTQHCGKCKSVMYCSRECQIKDWSSHKEECIGLTEDACKQQ